MTPRRAIVTHHWRERVVERLGRDVDAEALADAIAWEIEHTGHVEYIGRMSRAGKRAYRFRFSDDLCGAAVVVFEGPIVKFITLYGVGFRVSREGKASRRV